jgi:hypothetical protein
MNKNSESIPTDDLVCFLHVASSRGPAARVPNASSRESLGAELPKSLKHLLPFSTPNSRVTYENDREGGGTPADPARASLGSWFTENVA